MKKSYLIIIGIIIVMVLIYLLRKPIKLMTNDAIDGVIKFIIAHNEGGYVNDPLDKGGETKYGISKSAFPKLDIKNLTLDKAVEIYRTKYFAKLHMIVNPQLLYQVLDHAINAGVSSALKLYHEGISVDEYKNKRLAFYKKLKQFPRYGASWTSRINKSI